MSDNAEQLHSALIEPAIRKWLSHRGFSMGDFQGKVPLADVLRDQTFRAKLDEAMFGAAQADRPTYEKLMRGFATLAGVQWDGKLEQLSRNLSDDIANVAPYLMRWAPDVWDDLHGSQGSVASLTAAIANARKHDMEPTQAHGVAQKVFQELFGGDATKTRGFSAKDFGKMYGELHNRGMAPASQSIGDVSQQLTDYAGPLSAIRDSMSAQGHAPSMEEMFGAYDAVPDAIRGRGPAELEKQLRIGDILGREGGPFAMGARQTGLPGVDIDQATLEDALLRQQAAQSPLGNLMGAQQRLDEAGVTDMPPSTLSATQANQQALTPEMIDQLRSQQYTHDVQPRIQAYSEILPPQARSNPAIQGMVQDQVAGEMGYQDGQHLQSLLGPATVGNVPRVRQQAISQASVDQALSGMGRGGPTQRIVDSIKQPGANLQDVLRAGLNIVPNQQIQQALKLGCDAAETISLAEAERRLDAWEPFAGKIASGPPTVAVDMDGTLAQQFAKYSPNYIPDPRPGAKRVMDKFRDAGYRIIIFSVRGNKKLIKDWCEQHEIPFDYINENPDQPPGGSGKVLADCYVDDRAVSAEQAWSKIEKEVAQRIEA